MRWLERLSAVRKNRRTFYASGAENAGDAAEEALYNDAFSVLKAYGKTTRHWRVWDAVRVRHGNWRSEIDLLMWTDDRIYLIELKNWSGRLDVHDGELVQFRRYDGGMVQHGNLVKQMKRREEALRAWLKKHNAHVPQIERRILFYNPRLEFSDAVHHYFNNEVSSASEWISEVRRLARDATPSKADAERQAGVSAIDALSTWDTVHMYGARVVRGDIRSSKETIALDDGKTLRLHDRRRISRIEISAPRSYLRAVFGQEMVLTLTVHLRSGEVVHATVPIDTTIRAHAAGQPKTELVALRHVRELQFGGR